MAKERGGGCLVVIVLGEMGHELLVSMKPGLGKAWNSINNRGVREGKVQNLSLLLISRRLRCDEGSD